MTDRQLTIAGPSMPANTLAYLATPYTKYRAGLDLAYDAACMLTGRLLAQGIEAYSPIVHCHPIAEHANVDPLDGAFWLRYQEQFMQRCDVLIVAQLTGWKESEGIAHEIKFFIERKRKIYTLNPDTMRMDTLVRAGAA